MLPNHNILNANISLADKVIIILTHHEYLLSNILHMNSGVRIITLQKGCRLF